jgi:hypothetical protein
MNGKPGHPGSATRAVPAVRGYPEVVDAAEAVDERRHLGPADGVGGVEDGGAATHLVVMLRNVSMAVGWAKYVLSGTSRNGGGSVATISHTDIHGHGASVPTRCSTLSGSGLLNHKESSCQTVNRTFLLSGVTTLGSPT